MPLTNYEKKPYQPNSFIILTASLFAQEYKLPLNISINNRYLIDQKENLFFTTAIAREFKCHIDDKCHQHVMTPAMISSWKTTCNKTLRNSSNIV